MTKVVCDCVTYCVTYFWEEGTTKTTKTLLLDLLKFLDLSLKRFWDILESAALQRNCASTVRLKKKNHKKKTGEPINKVKLRVKLSPRHTRTPER